MVLINASRRVRKGIDIHRVRGQVDYWRAGDADLWGNVRVAAGSDIRIRNGGCCSQIYMPQLTAADAMVIAPVGALGGGVDAVAVSLRRHGKETTFGRFDLTAPGLAQLPRAPGGTTVLRLSYADILAKSLTLPLAAQPELRQVLSFEMDQETPFKPDELYWDHRLETTDRQKNRLSVRLMLVPKTSLAPLLGGPANPARTHARA